MRDLPEQLEDLKKNSEECQHHGTSPQALLVNQIRNTQEQSIFIYFPQDRNCEVCKRTKVTRAPCRKSTGDAVLRTENFGDFMTAEDVNLATNSPI